VLPYDYALRDFPAYLQQLEMESNGKRVTREGEAVDYATCPIVWGAPGNNGQHAFYQLLHQGTRLVPSDFIVPVENDRHSVDHENAVLANALAQTEALMRGRTEAEARAELEARGLTGAALDFQVPHRVLPGNQPTSTLVYRSLTPRVLGALIALYEHKVFTQSVIWGINAFDQWGVELGKQLAKVILPELAGERPVSDHDASTAGLIEYLRARRPSR
jgi:glucose-6-phosphate isomerase